MLHVFYNTERIATHSIPKGHFQYTTNDSHYPEDKIVDLNYHLSKARIDAKKIGENMTILIEKLIKADKFPLKNLRKDQGVLRLKDKYSNDALNEAAGLALEFNKLGMRSIQRFAKHYNPKKLETTAPARSSQFTCLQGGLSNE